MFRPIYFFFAFILLFVGAVASLGATSRSREGIDRTTVPDLELSRYLGFWFEVARFENRFERNLTCVTAQYILVDDNNIEVVNRGYNILKRVWSRAIGRAKRTSEAGRLRVSFFWIFYTDYNILALGDSGGNRPYDWALVGSKSRDYLWILSRTPTLNVATLDNILAIATSRGYDISRLQYISQNCAEETN